MLHAHISETDSAYDLGNSRVDSITTAQHTESLSSGSAGQRMYWGELMSPLTDNFPLMSHVLRTTVTHEFVLVANVVELLHHVTSKWNTTEKDDNAQLSGILHIKHINDS